MNEDDQELQEAEDRIIALLAQLETAEKLAADRLVTIQSMSTFLDQIAEALSLDAPKTPVDGIGAVWDVMEAIADLKTFKENHTATLFAKVRELYPDAGGIAVSSFHQTGDDDKDLVGFSAYAHEFPIGTQPQNTIAYHYGRTAAEVIAAFTSGSET